VTTEHFTPIHYGSAWTEQSDVWVILNPDVNQWTEKVDWSLGMLLRRTLLRIEMADGSKAARTGDPILLAAPEGAPAARVLVLPRARGEGTAWLGDLAPILARLKVRNVTVFAPHEWKAPSAKTLAEASKGVWSMRWVEPEG
jgi:hypothetical protein